MKCESDQSTQSGVDSESSLLGTWRINTSTSIHSLIHSFIHSFIRPTDTLLGSISRSGVPQLSPEPPGEESDNTEPGASST